MNNEEQTKKQRKFALQGVRCWLSRKSERTIEVEIPKGFMNCGVSTCNHFLADTNDNNFWDTLKFPLPKPKYKWNIKCYKGDMKKPQKQTVELIDCP